MARTLCRLYDILFPVQSRVTSLEGQIASGRNAIPAEVFQGAVGSANADSGRWVMNTLARSASRTGIHEPRMSDDIVYAYPILWNVLQHLPQEIL